MIAENAAPTHVKSPPVVHCFDFRGEHFAYLVRSGDLIRLSPAARIAFSAIEASATVEEALGDVRSTLGEDAARSIEHDLTALAEAELLTPEIALTNAQIDDANAALLAHRPRNLMFFVTEACNLACTYCYEKNQGVHDRPLSLKQVDARKILDRYFEESGGRDVTITFFGGEPLLNFKVVREAVGYALDLGRERGVAVGFTMTTNLTLLTEEIAEFLAEHKFHVMVSLDGAKDGNDRHRVFRDGSGTYDKATSNLKMLIGKMRSAGVRLPKIRATLTAGNSDAIAVEQHLRTLGTSLIEIGSTHGTVEGGNSPHDVASDSEEARLAHERVLSIIHQTLDEIEENGKPVRRVPGFISKNLQRIHEDISRAQLEQTPRPKLCGVCRNMKAVTPGGDLYPCHRYVGMPAFKMGNIHEGGLDREKVSNYYRALHENFASHCTQCWARYLCGGQCPWYLSTDDGKVIPPDEASCDGIRSSMETSLALYATLLERHPAAFKKFLSVTPESVRGVDPMRAPDESCQS